jgi:hypothetical protein
LNKEEGEEDEGIFSSLPLTLFSPSITLSTIDLFTQHGGLTLPRLNAMEWSHLFTNHLTENHPFFNVDYIFVTGPSDPLRRVLSKRVIVMYDSQWVLACVENGELVELEKYVVDSPIKIQVMEGNKEGKTEDDKIQTSGDVDNQQSSIPVNNTDPRIPTSDPSQLQLKAHLLKYPQRTVDLSDFTSAPALREASFNRISPAVHPPASRSTSLALIHPDTVREVAIAGPSKLSNPDVFDDAYIPFQSSSGDISTKASSPPVQLWIPYRELNQVKVKEFEKRVKESKT